MFILSFLIPLIIGLDNYGKYVLYFSIVGFFLGLSETTSFLLQNKVDVEKNEALYLIICLISIFSTFFITIYTNIEYYLILFILLPALIKNWIISNVSFNLNNPTNYFINIYTINLITYIFSIIFFYFCNILNYFLPIFMITFSSISVIIFSLLTKKLNFPKLKIKNIFKYKFFDLHIFLGKSFEDLFLTIGPIFIFKFYGPKNAAIYRIIISIYKLCSKIIPYKYELILLDYKKSKLLIGNMFHIFFALIIFSFIIYIIGIFNITPIYINTILKHPLILGVGPAVGLLVIYPLTVLIKPLIILPTTLLFGIQFLLFTNVNFLLYEYYIIFTFYFLFFTSFLFLSKKLNLKHNI
jgi:hypothetical protein